MTSFSPAIIIEVMHYKLLFQVGLFLVCQCQMKGFVDKDPLRAQTKCFFFSEYYMIAICFHCLAYKDMIDSHLGREKVYFRGRTDLPASVVNVMTHAGMQVSS